MYRWLLCWRYLRTRYIALASVISVTLGVATLIVVIVAVGVLVASYMIAHAERQRLRREDVGVRDALAAVPSTDTSPQPQLESDAEAVAPAE